jgi:SAM-dependent methyltransferase
VNRAIGVLELLDRPIDETAELEVNLADIAFANRCLGGIAPIRRELRRSGARSFVDVGCGGGDVAAALVTSAARAREELHATCVDRSEAVLAIARRRTGRDPRFAYVLGDGTRLPFDDGAFDVAICTLTLHHVEGDAAVALLRELRRVARLTPIVGDLVRSRIALAVTSVYAAVCARSRLTRHDAPLSVRRAYTPREALELARAAGWHAPRVVREPFFRMTLVDG